MSESELYTEILMAHSRGDTRLMRINSGFAWQGEVVSRSADRLVLAHPRAIKLGAPGVSDLIGWTTIPSGPSAGVAQFLAIEAKTARGRVTPEQSAFIALVKGMGGRAGVARSAADAGFIIHSPGAV